MARQLAGLNVAQNKTLKMSQNECCWSRIMNNIDEIYQESRKKAVPSSLEVEGRAKCRK
jgi:hypothetical protein